MKIGRQGGPIGIKQVAAKANVSVATVSRVLNGHAHVSNVVRRRVQRAIDELAYQPNAIARGLRKNTSNTIGVILRDVANTAFANLWKAASDVAGEQGYQVLLMSSERDPVKEAEAVRLMIQNRVSGIVAFVADESDSVLTSTPSDMPIVLVESELPGIDVDQVMCENTIGAYQAVSYLLSLGHRNIEMLAGSAKRVPGRERAAGYMQAYQDRKLNVNPSSVWAISHIDDKVRKQLRDRFLGSNPPTAIFAASSHLTVEALAFIRELGLRIPEDVSLIGFDNAALADFVTPKLTTVERNIYDIGVQAVETLLARIKAPNGEPAHKIILPATLNIRNSCQRLIADDTIPIEPRWQSQAAKPA